MKTTRIIGLKRIKAIAEKQLKAGYTSEQAITWLLSLLTASLSKQVDYDRVRARVKLAVKSVYK